MGQIAAVGMAVYYGFTTIEGVNIKSVQKEILLTAATRSFRSLVSGFEVTDYNKIFNFLIK